MQDVSLVDLRGLSTLSPFHGWKYNIVHLKNPVVHLDEDL